jgi:hypothetical protein
MSRQTSTPVVCITFLHTRVFQPFLAALAVMALLFTATLGLQAQTGGQAGIQGTVTDAAGAGIPHATVVATNNDTGTASTRETTGEGLFTIAPILPGTYTVSVKAPGFSEFVQQNLSINALVLTPISISMKVGASNTTVTVSEAPPQLETTNATLGLTIENDSYANLPLQMNNAQRDPTAFGSLAPGAQGGARLPIVGGTGNYLGQLYLDGLPAQTISQQGDNRLVSQAVSVDAIDQLQVITSTPPAEYSGAGAENFTIKSGGRKYHGQVSDFIRNTSFDAWPFLVKAQTLKNALGATIPAPKPVDHQNELSLTFGGHVPGLPHLFFFVAYDKFHSRRVANPAGYTIATSLERAGDFTELNCASTCGGTGTTGTGANNPAIIYDPTTTTCTSNGCTRQPFQGMKNGVPTNNVIPTSYLSPIAQKMQSFLPAPTNPASLTNNYTSGIPTGFDNHLIDYRVDYDLSEKHRISTVGAMGTVNYLNNFSAPYLPLPYVGGDYAAIYPKVFDAEDSYTISNSMVNQLKFGFTRFFQNIHDATQGVAQYGLGAFGITNLPAGQAGEEFPSVTFTSGSDNTNTGSLTVPLQQWTNGASAQTQLTTPNNFTLLDNLQWTKGRHLITAGITVQWQQINNANPATLTGKMSLTVNANSTANFTGTALNSTSGYSYSSFLLGAIGGSPSLGLNYVSEVGGRYRPIAPYLEDTWKVNNKLTVDAGLRWDYLPPYHEVKDRWSFLNPNITNAATGTPGALQFAGNYGGAGVSCNCRTPVQTYWKNWGPRVGITYAFTDKTVLRMGIGHVYSQGGGVGGRGNAFQGAGQTGFNTTAVAPSEITSGANAGPSFYLNNSAAFQTLGRSNTALGFTYPAAPAPSAASQILNTGNYLNNNGAFVTAAGVSYADPYFSGRAPDFTFFNAGIQQAFTSNMTLSINYVGNQSHHLVNSTSSGSNARGYWAGQLDPKYLAALGSVTDSTGTKPILTSPATAANVAKAQGASAGLNIPTFFQAAAASNASATIAQGLVAFPQYSGVSDIYGANVGNFSYNSLQVTMEQRLGHGLTFNFNYTWSKNIGDDGTFRSGYDIPQAAISGGTQSWHQDRIERGDTVVATPHSLHAYGVYQLPFGKGKIGSSSFWVRALAGGWQLSGIYTYASGTPMALTWGTSCASPGQGQCMPDINPAFAGPARINGSYGTKNGVRSACALGVGTGCVATQYFDPAGFKAAANVAPVGTVNLLGNAPRTAAYGLTNPGAQNIDTALRRSFKVREWVTLQVEADCLNTWNHTIFASASPTWAANSASFGTVTSVSNNPRDFQFAGHINF